MEERIQITRSGEDCMHLWHANHSVHVEREVLSAGSRLKRIVCSRLLGEISERQFDLQRSELLQKIRLLTQ